MTPAGQAVPSRLAEPRNDAVGKVDQPAAGSEARALPRLSPTLAAVRDSPLARIDELLQGDTAGDVVRLHQGKTYFPPIHEPSAWGRDAFELLAHEHAPPRGARQLRAALASRAADRLGMPVDLGDVVVTAGATHGISAVLHSILDRGAEVLVPSPQWLFATGLVHAAGGIPVEVPVFLELRRDPGFDFVAALESSVTTRTRAIYFNTPNNPTGHSFDEDALTELADFAERHNLWIIADNAYEHYDFTAGGFIDIASVSSARERTFSVYTFSKSYAMPGHRIGYVVVPSGLGPRMVNAVLFSIYSVATASQFAAFEALRVPEEEMRRRHELARAVRDVALEMLEVPHTDVNGGLYTFLDLSQGPLEGGRFVDRCLEAGVALAPGIAFGHHCSNYARVCFTAVPPDRMIAGIERVNAVWRESASS